MLLPILDLAGQAVGDVGRDPAEVAGGCARHVRCDEDGVVECVEGLEDAGRADLELQVDLRMALRVECNAGAAQLLKACRRCRDVVLARQQEGRVYYPEASLTVRLTVPVWTSVTAIVATDTAASEVSVTESEMVPRNSCARRAAGSRIMARAQSATSPRLRI